MCSALLIITTVYVDSRLIAPRIYSRAEPEDFRRAVLARGRRAAKERVDAIGRCSADPFLNPVLRAEALFA